MAVTQKDEKPAPVSLGVGFYGGLAMWAAYTAGQYYVWQDAQTYSSAQAWSDSLYYEIPIGMSILYLSFVTLMPKLVGDQAVGGKTLQDFMVAYNCYQVILNSAWCAVTLNEVLYRLPQPLIGAERLTNYNGLPMAFLIWMHYNNKFCEFLDTVFMVLRGKSKQQLSFLHVYHHVLMVWAWFIVLKYWNGGDAWFGAWLNSFIHICMYGYYFLTAIKIPCPWKKILTKMQMTQFCVCFTHACGCAYLRSVPVWICCVQIYVMVNMLVLFNNFYQKQYKAKKAAEAKSQ